MKRYGILVLICLILMTVGQVWGASSDFVIEDHVLTAYTGSGGISRSRVTLPGSGIAFLKTTPVL